VLVPSHEVHTAEIGLQANTIVNANAMVQSTEMKMNIQMNFRVLSEGKMRRKKNKNASLVSPQQKKYDI
jgi:hypothetical protein